MVSAMNISSSLLLSLAFLFVISATALDALCHPTDVAALLAIKASVNLKQSSWNTSTDCCTWEGIQCNNTAGRVTFLNIDPSHRPGMIPSAVGDLTFLQTLIINHHADLTGPIPSSIGRLTQLTWLQLSRDGLTGPIPSSLFLLPNIQYIDFTYNRLSGTIPATIPANSPLTYLYLYNNQLTGTIPGAFGKTNIKTFYFSNNNLVGPLPASFANAKFQLLDLSSNPLTGDASILFGAEKPLTTLLMSRNQLEFDLSKVVFPSSLQNLDLSRNKIYGSIPQEITKLESLVGLDLSRNKLCGQIPSGGQLGQFDQSSYVNNTCLCGSPLPVCSK